MGSTCCDVWCCPAWLVVGGLLGAACTMFAWLLSCDSCERGSMMDEVFTIGQLAERVTGGNEAAMRKLLRDAGADVDELRQDLEETVSREAVIDLVAMRAGDRVGRLCAEVLHGAQHEGEQGRV